MKGGLPVHVPPTTFESLGSSLREQDTVPGSGQHQAYQFYQSKSSGEIQVLCLTRAANPFNILEKSNRPGLGMLRSLIFYIVLFFATILCGTAAMVSALLSRRGNLSHLIARLWGRILLFAAGVKVRVEGLQNVAPDQAYVFAANHQSLFDIFVLLAHLPTQFRWLAKKELFRLPFLGAGMKGAGYIPIDRSNRREAFRSIDLAAARVREGTSIVIFPEGTRTVDGTLQSFKKGGFHLAIKSRRPIVPVSVSGTFAILPKKGFRIRPQTVLVYVGDPVPTENLSVRDRDWLISEIRKRMRERLPPAEKGDLEPSKVQPAPEESKHS